MKKFKVAVLDAQRKDLEKTCMILENVKREQRIPMEIFQTQDAGDLLYELEEKRHDLYLLDMELGEKSEMDGVQVAVKIREKDALVPIVFITNRGDSAIKGYKVNAYDYLLKSGYQKELEGVVQKLYAEWQEDLDRVVLKTSHGGWETVARKDIYYVQVERRQCRVCVKGKNFYISRSLQSMKEELGEGFVYARKDCLVNIQNVKGRQGKQLRMENGELIEVSRKYKDDLHFT